MLAAKENDIVKARQAERGTKAAAGGNRASAWQRKVDAAEGK